MSAANLGGDRSEPDRQILNAQLAKPGLQPRAEALAADQAAPGEREIEQAEYPAPGQSAGERLEHVEPSGRIAAANQCADRRADDDIELQAQSVEFPQRPDMRPAARRARAEHEPDLRSAPPPLPPAGSDVDSTRGRSEHRSIRRKLTPPLAFRRET